MKNRLTVFAFLLVAVMSVSAFAQGQGRGGRGMMGRGAQMGQQTGIRLALRPDVQADLQVTDDQKTKLDGLRTSMRGTRPGGGGPGGGGGTMQRPTAEEMAARRAEQRKQLAAILTADQMKRLDEIEVQLAGNSAILNADVQKKLELTTDQIAKVTTLREKFQEAQTSVFEKMRSGDLDREKARESMTQNQKTLNDELAKVLTTAQTDKLKELGGKPFKADDEPTR